MYNNQARNLLLCISLTIVCGCAQIKIYNDPTLNPRSRTGIPFYINKPYLLVSQTGAKEKPIDVSIVYLSDLSKPMYAYISPGIGSSKTALTFSNSTLTSLNQESDPKLAELLGALGGLQTSFANAAKTRKETSLLGDQSAIDYTQQALKLLEIAKDLQNQINLANKGNFLTSTELTILNAALSQVTGAANNLNSPTTSSSKMTETIVNLKNALKNWSNIQESSTVTSGQEPEVRRQLTALKKQTQDVLDAISPKPEEAPTFKLYEIDNSKGITTLTEVKF